jgi:hypothetical protein
MWLGCAVLRCYGLIDCTHTELCCKLQMRLRYASHKAVFCLFQGLQFIAKQCSQLKQFAHSLLVSTVCVFNNNTGVGAVKTPTGARFAAVHCVTYS